MRIVGCFVWAIAGVLAAGEPLLAEGPIVWAPSSTLLRVSPEENAGSNQTAQIYAARGEVQSFQIAVRASSSDLTDVNVSVSELVCSKTGTTIPRSDIALFREKYMTVLQHSPTYNGPPNLPITNISSFPDVLIPFLDPETGEVPKGGNYVAVPVNVCRT